MKHKKLNSLRQNILYKKSPMNNGKTEKTVLSNLYSNSIPIKFHDSSNKNDELLMKNKIFNYNKNLNHLTLGSFFHNNHNSFKTLNKNHSNIKKNNIINNSKEQSINKSKKNYNISKSIDSSINNNNSKDLFTLNKNNNNNIPLYNLFNKTLFNNNNSKTSHISLNKIKTTRDNIAFFSKSGNKFNHKNMPGLNFDKISKNKKLSITSINSRESTPKKKNILLKKNLQNINKIIKNEKNESQNYRKYLFNEKITNINLGKKGLEQYDEARKEIIQIINENKMKNKGLFYLYNHQTNLANQKKNLKCATKYPSFNSPKNIAINNSNLYNISKGDISYKKPFMVFAPSSNNSINKTQKQKQKEDKSKEYVYSCKNENNNDIYNILSDMSSNQNEENNDKRMSSTQRKNKKSINRLQIFSKNDSNKNMNNNNNDDNNNNNLDKKVKINKKISNNFVSNKEKDKIIEKISSFSNSDKEIRKKSEQNNNELIPKKQKSVGTNNDTTKKESKNESNNIKTISKTIEKSENLFEDISQISKTSTAIKDSSYYMEKSKKLINYIKEFYTKNNKYPDTKINFYLYGRRIGQGAFGKVNLGLNVLTGRVVAIKSFKKTKEAKHNSNMNKILYETGLMKRFNHPNITKILEVFHDEEYMLIIMEYINGGNLFNFVKKRRKLSEKTAKFLFRQIILGIKHIHSQNIVHRDIKLENIIIDLNNNVKICDFGIGKVINSADELLYDKCGTPMYMAPEIILSNKKNGYKGFPVDIWSSGITLYIMLSGTLPFTVKNKSIEELSLKDMKNKKESSDLKYQIVNGYPKKIKKISSEAKDLLNGLLNKNPDKRLTCDEILNHPWLKDEINEICDNNKYHLFTKAEMTMMSKTYIDYRKGELEDLRENFTITNLKSDEIRIEEKNISTKSSILAPFNSALNSSSYSSKKDKFDDSNNSKINLENDLIIYNNKVKEYNLNYELNNNQEVDNGMLIKTKSDMSSLISDKNNSVISHNDEKNKKENNNISFDSKTDLNKNHTNTNENCNYINEKNPKTIKILNEIESFGYKKDYVINCIKNNILCHASTNYYLLKNYGDID